MAQLQAAGGAAKVMTITERLSGVRGGLRNSHNRIVSAASRAGLLEPLPPASTKEAPENSDLNNIVRDIEHLCELLVQDCSEIEKIV